MIDKTQDTITDAIAHLKLMIAKLEGVSTSIEMGNLDDAGEYIATAFKFNKIVYRLLTEIRYLIGAMLLTECQDVIRTEVDEYDEMS